MNGPCSGNSRGRVYVGRVDGATVEVYPDAGYKLWGLPYKYKKHPTVLSGAVQALHDAAPWPDLGGYSTLHATQHNAFDAVALLARAVALGATYLPDDDERSVAEREGWVHVPTVPLARLVDRDCDCATTAAPPPR